MRLNFGNKLMFSFELNEPLKWILFDVDLLHSDRIDIIEWVDFFVRHPHTKHQLKTKGMAKVWYTTQRRKATEKEEEKHIERS